MASRYPAVEEEELVALDVIVCVCSCCVVVLVVVILRVQEKCWRNSVLLDFLKNCARVVAAGGEKVGGEARAQRRVELEAEEISRNALELDFR